MITDRDIVTGYFLTLSNGRHSKYYILNTDIFSDKSLSTVRVIDLTTANVLYTARSTLLDVVMDFDGAVTLEPPLDWDSDDAKNSREHLRDCL